jgi:hypothetical protein
MKTTFFRVILTTLAFGHLCENRVQAAVESLGDKASITIPNTWTVSERTASTLVASNASGSIQLAIAHYQPNEEKTIYAKTYKSLDTLLENILKSGEVDLMASWTKMGYHIANVSDTPQFYSGYLQNNELYGVGLTRWYAISNNTLSTVLGIILNTDVSFDGHKIYISRAIVNMESTNSAEVAELDTIHESLTSTNITSPLSDPDGDGLSNFDEIILYGTNPNSSDMPQGTTYQGPTITSDLSSVSVPVSQNIIPYEVTTNFGANAFTATGLPKGIKINARTGVITGKPTKKGKYTVRVTASKKQGKAVTDSVMTSKSVTVY